MDREIGRTSNSTSVRVRDGAWQYIVRRTTRLRGKQKNGGWGRSWLEMRLIARNAPAGRTVSHAARARKLSLVPWLIAAFVFSHHVDCSLDNFVS